MGLLAIMFVLLFTFPSFLGVLANPPMRGISADLARVHHSKEAPRANREDAIIVAVMRDGVIYLHGDRMTSESLPKSIRAAVDAGADPRVYIRADARAKYGAVKDAIDGVRDAHVDRITFLVEDERR